MARPPKEIDAEVVFKLAKLGCTLEDIGDFVGCDPATIHNRFSKEFQLGKGDMKKSLRRAQFKKAFSGCATMLVHLGKVYLNQTDRVDVTSNGKPLQPVFESIRNDRDQEIRFTAETNGVCHE